MPVVRRTISLTAAKDKAANQSVGGGKAGVAARDKTKNLDKECLEPGCQGVKLTSLSVCKTHWSNKHCTCRREPCECFPAEKYEPMFTAVEEWRAALPRGSSLDVGGPHV